LPTASVEVVSVALPDDNSTAPSVAAPSKKVTVPVGVPDPGGTGLTVAVKVTDWPKTVGFADEATDVVVLLVLLFTV
jgi:hypothetical protein